MQIYVNLDLQKITKTYQKNDYNISNWDLYKRKAEKMNKKALILALFFVMLTGCGNKTDETKTSESNKLSVESTEKVKDLSNFVKYMENIAQKNGQFQQLSFLYINHK